MKMYFILQFPCCIGHEINLSEDKAGSVVLFSPNCWTYQTTYEFSLFLHIILLVSRVKRISLLTALSTGEALLRRGAISAKLWP